MSLVARWYGGSCRPAFVFYSTQTALDGILQEKHAKTLEERPGVSMTKVRGGCIKTRYLFNHVIVFFTLIVFSGGELPLEKKCDFSSFLWVWKHTWSRVNKRHLLFPFPFIAFYFTFMSSNVPFMLHLCPFMLHSFPFVLLSRPFMFHRKTDQVCICLHARVFFIFCYRFWYRLAIVLAACAGCHLQASWTYTCISSLSFSFTLIVFWAGNALAVLTCKPS